MNLSAKISNLRMSPRKVQLVTRLIAGLSIDQALAQLTHSPKLASTPITKLLKSAVANTISQLNVKEEDIYIKEITVNQGPTLQRYKPRAFGRAGKIRKRTSHVSVILGILDKANVDLEKAKKKQDSILKPTNLEEVEKERAKAADSEKKEEKTKKTSGTEEAEKEVTAKNAPQSKKPDIGKAGSKGADSKFMKKLFSRKVG